MAIEVQKLRGARRRLVDHRDVLWFTIWIAGLGFMWIWDLIFLNAPALARVESAFVNSLFTGLTVVVLSLAFGWGAGVGLHLLDRLESRWGFAAVSFAADLIRSVPQILIVLFGYIVLTALTHAELLRTVIAQLLFIATVISFAVFLEIADTVRSRIEYFRTLDFVDAMLCCGISERRILNVEILWKNSRSHLLHKLIAVFGASIFLQCSIDFIVSVGLSTDVSLSNFPLTLGSLLATMDSKQDILALSNLVSDPGYLPVILVRHLQGLSVAFCIVFTLLCMYNIGNGFVRRHRLA